MLRRGECPSSRTTSRSWCRKVRPPAGSGSWSGATAAVEGAEFVFLCVPTPQDEDGSADLSFVEAVAAEIGPHLLPGTVIVNKSTVPVGSTLVVERVLGRQDVHRGVQPRVPAGGDGGPRQPPSRAHRRRGRRPVGGGQGGRAVRRHPRPASHHRRSHRRDHQVRLQRLPGHQAQLRQRRRRSVRGGRRRCTGRHPGPGLRQAHRVRIPSTRSGVGRELSAQGHPGAGPHRRAGRL